MTVMGHEITKKTTISLFSIVGFLLVIVPLIVSAAIRYSKTETRSKLAIHGVRHLEDSFQTLHDSQIVIMDALHIPESRRPQKPVVEREARDDED